MKHMKQTTLALALALTVVSWAQTATQTAPSTPQQSTAPADKAKCPCCDKMGAVDAKGGNASCARHGKDAADGKGMASCCAGKVAVSCCGKDAKSCMRSDKDKTANYCKDCGKDKAAMACCSGNGGNNCKDACCSSKRTARNRCAEALHG